MIALALIVGGLACGAREPVGRRTVVARGAGDAGAPDALPARASESAADVVRARDVRLLVGDGARRGLARMGDALVLGLQYAPDGATPLLEGEPMLEALRAWLIGQPRVTGVTIAVHSLPVGSRAHNLELTERRAIAVARWLVERGIDCRRLDAVGRGPDRPVSDGPRELQRRTEVTIGQLDGAPAEWRAGRVDVCDAMRGAFWSSPRAGTNAFHHVPDPTLFAAARAAGASFVRLAPDKWTSARRDFLVGDADHFDALVPEDLARLRSVLDAAHAAGVRVVLTMLSLPGTRWRQHNGDRDDVRLFTDAAMARAASSFWRQLAHALRGHPALVGYDVLNEPIPDPTRDPTAGARIDAVHRALVAAIRAEDPTMPVVIECGRQGSPDACGALVPIDDASVLYSFHMYEPYGFTNLRENGGNRRWPDPAHGMTRESLARWMAPMVEWQARHAIPSTRILVGELGCNRMVPGAARWLEDVVSLVEERGWHWAYYSFREDRWPGMDYEVGARPLDEATWAALDRGDPVDLRRGPNPIFDVLAHHLRARAGSPLVEERIDDDLRVRLVRPRVYVVTHERPFAANSLLVEMDDGTLVLCGSPYTPAATRALLHWAQARWGPSTGPGAGRRRIVAIATHFHYDAIGGASALAEAGVEHWASDVTVRLLRTRGRAMRALMLSVLEGEPADAAMFRGWLPSVPRHVFTQSRGLDLAFGSEHVRVIHPGAGHSPDNLVVHFPELGVLFGGCAVVAADRPGYVGDADLAAWPAAVERMQTLEADIVIPGHGDRFDRDLLEHTIRAVRARAAEPAD